MILVIAVIPKNLSLRLPLCRQTLRHIEISQRGLQEGERSARSVLDNPLHVARHQPIVERPFAIIY